MKKLLAILLVVAMLFSFAAVASANTFSDPQARGIQLFESTVDALENQYFTVSMNVELFGRNQTVTVAMNSGNVAVRMRAPWAALFGDAWWGRLAAFFAPVLFGNDVRLVVLGDRAAVVTRFFHIDINSEILNSLIDEALSLMPVFDLSNLPTVPLEELLTVTQYNTDTITVALADDPDALSFTYIGWQVAPTRMISAVVDGQEIEFVSFWRGQPRTPNDYSRMFMIDGFRFPISF